MGLFTILPARGVIGIAGPERREFLNSLITNEICDDRPIYAALLTPQGRYLHDFFVIPHDNELLLDCESSRRADLLERLQRYKLRREILIQDRTRDYIIACCFPALAPPAQGSYIDPRHPNLGQRILIPIGEIDRLRHALISQGCKEMTVQVYDQHRLSLGIPDGSRDMEPEHALPLEHNLDLLNGISFSKGCYVGQELTARMHHRKLVKKRLVPVKLQTPADAGTPIMAGNSIAGELRSSHNSSGLAFLRLEFKNQNLTLNGTCVNATWPETDDE